MGISTSALGAMGMMTQAAGGITKAGGAYFSDRMKKAQYGYEAFLADENAKTADLSAKMALSQGQTQVQQIGIRTANQEGQAKAAYAGAGIDLSGGGTPTRVIGSNNLIGEVDANIAATNAIKQAWGYRMQGVNDQNEAAMDRLANRNIHPAMDAYSSLMGSAGDVSSSWYQMGKSGALGG